MSEKSQEIAIETAPQEISQNWLKRLKEESWEAELLVSAIAIFGTFQLFSFIEWVTNKFIDYLHPDQYTAGQLIVFVGMLAVSILVSMFVIHFSLRAYWVGLIGLSSVFPDYSVKDSAYSQVYTHYLLSILPKLKDTLHKVDELCSVIFSAAFSILFTYAYVAFVATVYVFIYNALVVHVPKSILLLPLALVVFIGFIHGLLTLIGYTKKLKENHAYQHFLFKSVKVIYIVTYGPMYKYLIQITMIFGSNFKKKKALIGLLILFFFTGIMVAIFKTTFTNIPYLSKPSIYFDKTLAFAGYYRSENQNRDFLLSPEIDSDVIKSGAIRLFIPIYSHEEFLHTQVCGLNKYAEDKELKRQHYLDCYHEYHKVLLNEKPVEISFMTYRHPITQQQGIVGYLNTNEMPVGNNTLTIKKGLESDIFSQWSIPFYYVGSR